MSFGRCGNVLILHCLAVPCFALVVDVDTNDGIIKLDCVSTLGTLSSVSGPRSCLVFDAWIHVKEERWKNIQSTKQIHQKLRTSIMTHSLLCPFCCCKALTPYFIVSGRNCCCSLWFPTKSDIISIFQSLQWRVFRQSLTVADYQNLAGEGIDLGVHCTLAISPCQQHCTTDNVFFRRSHIKESPLYLLVSTQAITSITRVALKLPRLQMVPERMRKAGDARPHAQTPVCLPVAWHSWALFKGNLSAEIWPS